MSYVKINRSQKRKYLKQVAETVGSAENSLIITVQPNGKFTFNAIMNGNDPNGLKKWLLEVASVLVWSGEQEPEKLPEGFGGFAALYVYMKLIEQGSKKDSNPITPTDSNQTEVTE